MEIAMSKHYPTPIFFVTVNDQPASVAVMHELNKCLGSDPPASTCRIVADGSHLLSAYNTSVDPNTVVAIFDTFNSAKRFKPFHRSQPDSHRPRWASTPQWSVKVNTSRADDAKVIRNCAHEIAAWFRRHIKDAIPDQSYPWGPITRKERNTKLQAAAKAAS